MNIAIIGASTNRESYSNKAIRVYKKHKYKIFPINPYADFIEEIKAYKSILEIKQKVDIVSIYVNPKIGIKLVDEIIKKRPNKVILNPGSESNQIIEKLKEAGLKVQLICSIQALGEDPKDY